jgi:hypothetical protein
MASEKELVGMSQAQRKSVVVGLLALAALAVGVFFLLSSGSGSAGGAPESAVSGDDLSILADGSSETREALPAEAQAWLTRLEATENPATEKGQEISAVGAATAPDGGEVVVAGMGGDVCAFFVDLGVSGCAPLHTVQSGEAFLVKPGCEGHLVMGVVPDGLSDLTAKSPEGTTDVPIASNVYVTELPPLSTSISGTTESGEDFSFSVPLDKSPRNCN